MPVFDVAGATQTSVPYWHRRALRKQMNADADLAEQQAAGYEKGAALAEQKVAIDADELALKWAEYRRKVSESEDVDAKDVLANLEKASTQAAGVFSAVSEEYGESAGDAAAQSVWTQFQKDGIVSEDYKYDRNVLLGIAKGIDEDENTLSRDRKIADYQETFGVSRDQAIDLVDGNLEVTGSTDELGFVTVTNKRTNEAYKIPGRAADDAGILDTEEQQQEVDSFGQYEGWAKPVASVQVSSNLDRTVVRESQQKMHQVDGAISAYKVIVPDDVMQAAGSMNILQRGANGFAQAITLNLLPRFAEDETDAANKVAQFNQAVRAGIVNSARFPVWEQQVVSDLLPDPTNIFKDPEGEAIKLSNLFQRLQQIRENEVALMENRTPNVIPRSPIGIKADPIIVNSEEEALEYPAGVWVSIGGKPYEIGER